VAFEELDGFLETRVVAGVHVDDLPSVCVAELAPLRRAANKPDVAMAMGRGARMAPPPDGQPRLAPEHHDPDFQWSLEVDHRLVLGLHYEAWANGLEGRTLVDASLLLHEVLEVPRQIINGHLRTLTWCRPRHVYDACSIAHVSRLDDDIVGIRATQVTQDEVLYLFSFYVGPVYDQECRHLWYA
jgi:hypothetical protein